MRKQYSGPFQAKLTWMTPALQLLELLMSTLKNACLWNMQNTPTLSSLNHNVPSPLPASWSGSNMHICTYFQVSLSLSLSLSRSLAFGTMQFYRTPKNVPPKKKKRPNLNYVITGTSEEHYFFVCVRALPITIWNVPGEKRGMNATWRTPSLAPENDFFFLVSYLSAVNRWTL